ncbi:MAG: response regulator [Bacteroidota bacterium]|nr:response regulator [Bacteroidota bacterium]
MRKRILLIDDDVVGCYLISSMIKEINADSEIIVANDGNEALNILLDSQDLLKINNQNNLPELIFLDIHMPGMDGIEFLDVIFKLEIVKNNNIPIYLLTSSDYHKDFEKASHYKIEGYIAKPISNELLESIITKYENV